MCVGRFFAVEEIKWFETSEDFNNYFQEFCLFSRPESVSGVVLHFPKVIAAKSCNPRGFAKERAAKVFLGV